MAVREPTSTSECVYYSYRDLPGGGEAMTWVFKEKCTKCGKGFMGKPKGGDGKVKIRAKEYTCEFCGYTVEKVEYESSLTANIKYTCPLCKKLGVSSVPYKKKTIAGVSTLRATCQHCKGNIDITKKMKDPKKKGSDDFDDED